MLTLLAHFSKNFVRKNFVREKFNFNGILAKRRVFDKKVMKTSLTTQFHR